MLKFNYALVVALGVTISLMSPVSAGVRKSLVIGVDGLGPMGLGRADTPSIDSLLDGSWATGYNGAYATGAHVGGIIGTPSQQVTSSGPGWSSILHGVWNDRHGVTGNSYSGRNFGQYPTYFETLEEANFSLYTASVIQWSPIDTYSIASVDDGNSQMDFRSTPGGMASVVSVTNTQLATKNVGAMFIHLDDVDHAGHVAGISSAYYKTTVETVDAHVGSILDTIRNRANFINEDWQIIIIGDHGHKPLGGHGGQSVLERNNVFLISSKQVANGYIPSSSMPRPAAVDVAASVLTHMDVAIPSGYVGVPRGQTVINPNLSQGLVLYLPFDGYLGDESGSTNTNNATVGGGQPTFIDGMRGQAVRFDGVDDYLALGDGEDFQFGTDTDFTVSMWIAVDGDQPGSDPAIISNKNWASGSNTGWGLFIDNGDDWQANAATPTGGRVDSSLLDLHSNGLSDPRFHHIAAVFDRDGDITIYKDGMPVQSVAMTSGMLDALGLNIGQDGTGSFNDFFEGAIDDLMIWQRALSADEVNILASAPFIPDLLNIGPPNGIVGDVNQDGVLDQADIDDFIAGYGTTGHLGLTEKYAHGDLNFDGVTNLHDLGIIHDAFDIAGISFPGATVPEPGMCALLGLLGFASFKRRKK